MLSGSHYSALPLLLRRRLTWGLFIRAHTTSASAVSVSVSVCRLSGRAWTGTRSLVSAYKLSRRRAAAALPLDKRSQVSLRQKKLTGSGLNWTWTSTLPDREPPSSQTVAERQGRDEETCFYCDWHPSLNLGVGETGNRIRLGAGRVTSTILDFLLYHHVIIFALIDCPRGETLSFTMTTSGKPIAHIKAVLFDVRSGSHAKHGAGRSPFDSLCFSCRFCPLPA